MTKELAETGNLQTLLQQVGAALDQFLRFEHPDAVANRDQWRQQLDLPLPVHGIGIDRVTAELTEILIPNGAAIVKPGFSGYITTGAVSVAALAATAASIASPQRYLLTAFNFCEELSLRWLSDLCGLKNMQGIYSSGGSVANLLALGAARQQSFERRGRDPAADGMECAVGIYATREAHHTIQRAAGVLGVGRHAVRQIACDRDGRMLMCDLQRAIEADQHAGILPMAIVANAGTTNTGAIDPLLAIAEVAQNNDIWMHVDGAYGLPGILDPRIARRYDGLELADSVIVDPHKWLGATVGVAATFVRDRELLRRAFTQEPADYLEGSVQQSAASERIEHSMDAIGIPYYDYGVELSAPCRGVIVWAMLREIGMEGIRARVIRHNDMARHIAQAARQHPNLELLQEPTLSICCFRYIAADNPDPDQLNQEIYRRLIHENRNLPSTTRVNGQLALRPCFVGARSDMAQAEELIADVLRLGAQIVAERPTNLDRPVPSA